MRFSKKLMTCSVAALLLSTAFAGFTQAEDDRDVVHDYRGNVVRNTFGNCVRTNWESPNDECAPRAMVVEQHHQRRAREMAREERTVYFAFNHAEIMPSQMHKLDGVVNILRSDDQVRDVRIVGYADRIGSVSYNKHLSEHRAKNVENYLHKRGYLNTSLAKVRWLGKSDPVTHCPAKLGHKDLIACLQRDRRVEIEIDYYPARNYGHGQ